MTHLSVLSDTTDSTLLANESETLSYGIKLAQLLGGGGLLFLQGVLGAGKTSICRGILRGLGYSGHVKSPTYTLMEPYQCGALSVFHFDLYRLASPLEMEYIGGRDYFSPAHLCLVEWPERGLGWLPEPDWIIRIQFHKGARLASFEVPR